MRAVAGTAEKAITPCGAFSQFGHAKWLPDGKRLPIVGGQNWQSGCIGQHDVETDRVLRMFPAATTPGSNWTALSADGATLYAALTVGIGANTGTTIMAVDLATEKPKDVFTLPVIDGPMNDSNPRVLAVGISGLSNMLEVAHALGAGSNDVV